MHGPLGAASKDTVAVERQATSVTDDGTPGQRNGFKSWSASFHTLGIPQPLPVSQEVPNKL